MRFEFGYEEVGFLGAGLELGLLFGEICHCGVELGVEVGDNVWVDVWAGYRSGNDVSHFFGVLVGRSCWEGS